MDYVNCKISLTGADLSQ